MIPTTETWFWRLGFQVWQVPGMSRAWRYEFTDGSYVLVTDLGGYDLPDLGGPYAVMSLSPTDELIESHEWLHSTGQLFRWFKHTERLIFKRTQSSRPGARAGYENGWVSLPETYLPALPATKSPCQGDCTLEPSSRLCSGCSRTIDEIVGWTTFSDADKRRVIDACAARKVVRDVLSNLAYLR